MVTGTETLGRSREGRAGGVPGLLGPAGWWVTAGDKVTSSRRGRGGSSGDAAGLEPIHPSRRAM